MKNNLESELVEFGITKLDETKRIIFGVVYTPNRIDAKGWYMEPKEVEKMAYRFMKLNLSQAIDTQHDNIPNGCYPVQSFIARANDPDYPEGSWVLGVQVRNNEIWDKIVKGELNAYSMEIMVKRVPAEVTYETTPIHVGETEPAEDGHTHKFVVEIDSVGRVIKGKTSTSAGHSHEINLNSVTNEHNKHAHRYFLE